MSDHELRDRGIEAGVVEYEAARYRAMLDRDIPALKALLSPNLLYVHTSGIRDTRETYLRKLKDGVIVYHQARWDLEAVEHWRGGAIILARVEVAGTLAGEPLQLDSLALTVWRPEGTELRMVAHHPTDLRRGMSQLANSAE